MVYLFMPQNIFSETPRLLAILAAETGSYSHIDKLANAPNREMALRYLQESLRDYNSLISRGEFDNPKARDEVNFLHTKHLEDEIEAIKKISNPRELKEVLAFISAKALARTVWLKKEAGQTRSESEKEEGE